MKTLYIARHAKSSWDDPLQSDFDRPLNARGERDAPQIARYLATHGVHPERILASPAHRARRTAEIYHTTLGGLLQFDRRIYEASVTGLLYLVQEAFEQTDSLMILGHNPGMTELINRLSSASLFNLPTAGVVGIKWNNNGHETSIQPFFYATPKSVTIQ